MKLSGLRGRIVGQSGRRLGGSLLGAAVLQVLGVITGIMLARGLGPSDRGAFAAMLLWPTIMVTLGDFGLGHSFAYFSASTRVPVRRMAKLASTAAATQTLYLVPLTLVAAWFGLRSAHAEPLSAGLTLAAAFVPAALLSRYVAAIFQGWLVITAFYAIRITMPVVIALALLLAFALNRMTVWGVVLAYLAGLTAMGIVSIVAPYVVNQGGTLGLGPKVPLPFDRREFLGYGLRALPGSLYPVEGLFLDQLLVALFLGPHDLGLYVAALAFTSLPRLVAYAVGVNAMPTVANNSAGRQRDLTLRFILVALGVLLPTCIGLVAIMPVLLPAVFGEAFAAAVDPARLLVLGSVAFGVRQVVGQCMRGAGRPGVVSIVEVGSWPLIVGAVAVGKTAGLTGVTIGLLMVQILSLVILLATGLRSAPVLAAGDFGEPPE